MQEYRPPPELVLPLLQKSSADVNQSKLKEPYNSKCEKVVVLKHIFENAKCLEKGTHTSSDWEERFNVKWKVSMTRRNDHLAFFVLCKPVAPTKQWSIRTKTELTVVGQNDADVTVTQDHCYEHLNRLTFDDFLKCEKMEKDYLVDGNLTVEVKVGIMEKIGLQKEKIRRFDESQKEVSDVVVTVDDTTFCVSKMHLASQSSVFKSLLLENSSVSEKSEVELSGIDPDGFHAFLEVLYGESAINDSNVEEMLLIADKFDAPVVKRRCEEFLLKESKKTIEIKCNIANRYHLDNRDFKCKFDTESEVKKITANLVFKDVLELNKEVDNVSDWRESFNVKWNTSLKRCNNHVGIYFQCMPSVPEDKWSIQTNIELKVVGRNQKDVTVTQDYCYEDHNGLLLDEFLEWDKLEEEYLVNGNLTIETEISIIEATGLRKSKIRKFDESQKDVSDIVLVVQNAKFYVSRKFLAFQSSHFKSLFIENSSVSNKPKVALPGTDPDYFHYFLEVLYGESAIDDSNVEELLSLAEKFDAPTVKKRCEEFLLKESEKPFATRKQMANRYHLENWISTYESAYKNSEVRQFTLKHVFKNVPSFKKQMFEYSEWDEHFNVNWIIGVQRWHNHLGFKVFCKPVAPLDKWTVKSRIECKVVGRYQNDVTRTCDYCYEKLGGWGFPEFLEWGKMEREYLTDGNLSVEAKVTIIEITGLGGNWNYRKFDESEKYVSDVIMLVNGRKFYVSRKYLAQSSLLKDIMDKHFQVSSNPEITLPSLPGFCACFLQSFLEVLYGEPMFEDEIRQVWLYVRQRLEDPTLEKKCKEYLDFWSESIEKNYSNFYHSEKKDLQCATPSVNLKTKQFMLKNLFKNVTSYREEMDNFSAWEDHFNVNWMVNVKRFKNHLAFHVHCDPIAPTNKWSLQTKLEFKVVGGSQKDVTGTHGYCFERSTRRGFNQFLKWEIMEEEYLINGSLTVEIKVTIIETTGLGKKKIRKFDESQKDVSDFTLVVRNTKFHVSKTNLSTHSTFFSKLLFGYSSELKNFFRIDEMTLTEIDPNDFHYFLESLYGEYSIDDSTIEGILLLADKPTKNQTIEVVMYVQKQEYRPPPELVLRLLQKSSAVVNQPKRKEPYNSKCEKVVVLKHVFKNDKCLEKGTHTSSNWEERFNTKWQVSVKRENDHLAFTVFCEPIAPTHKWSIRTKTELTVMGQNDVDVTVTQDHCYEEHNELTFDDFLECEKMEKGYLVNGNLTVEVMVGIMETTGLRKEEIRSFDESQKEVSDVVVTVDDTTFCVSKMHLASQSSVFKSLLLENSSVSEKSEVELSGIDPDGFHAFLEVLYGESAIDDSNVEEMLLIADKFDAPVVKRRCEEFLLKESKKTIETKCNIANRYHLDNRDYKCTFDTDSKKITENLVFKDVLKLNEEVDNVSEWRESFNVKWNTSLKRCNNHVGIYFQCMPSVPEDKWSIQTNIELKVVGRNQKDLTVTQDYCYEDHNGLLFDEFLEWDKLEEEYLVNGNLTIGTEISIIEATGLRISKIRKFDESQKDVSDIVLVVQNAKFYVSRKFLASQSSHFKSLFIENSSVSNKSEVELPGIDPDYFHYFLEVLYGESAIDDSNVEEVLVLAEKFDAPTAKRRCEEFLLKESKKTFRTKHRLANRYCFNNRNFAYLIAIAPSNNEFPNFTMKHVFKNVNEFEDNVDNYSEKENHFNANWWMSVKRDNNHLGFYIHCDPIAPLDKWSIRTKFEWRVVGSNQNDVIRTWDHYYEIILGFGFDKFLDWEMMEREYLVDGKLTVEAKVEIIETSGLGITKIGKFDESPKDVADVILLVSGYKFYVSKKYLAQSSLKDIVENHFKVSNNPEIELPAFDIGAFHSFLEVLYGETIDDKYFGEILFLAKRFDAPRVKRKCEELRGKNIVKNSECTTANIDHRIKQFMLKNSFNNVTSYREEMDNFSAWEDHFNVNWFMNVKRFKNHLAFHVHCDPIAPTNKWSLQTKLEFKVVGGSQKDVTGTHGYCFERSTRRGFNQFLKWEIMEEEYLINGSLTVEIKVTIIETTGLGKKKIRKFDESQKDVSDFTLVVRNTKFHVSKTNLSTHSTFFSKLLFGYSSELKNFFRIDEMTLTEIDPNDFHYFLELLYGEFSIDDSTIEGVLMLAEKYQTPIVVRKCTDFLLNWSRKSLKKKLEQSVKYNFEELKKKCISEIKTVADVRKVLEDNVYGMNQLIIEELFDNLLYLH
ncbi:unnamed protein product [Caenorhabditis nigoni]